VPGAELPPQTAIAPASSAPTHSEPGALAQASFELHDNVHTLHTQEKGPQSASTLHDFNQLVWLSVVCGTCLGSHPARRRQVLVTEADRKRSDARRLTYSPLLPRHFARSRT
jgi:hypothetical protein